MQHVFCLLCGSNKKSIMFCVFSVLSIAVMVIIFCFSAQNSLISQSTSDGVLSLVIGTIENLLKGAGPETVSKVIFIITCSFRKLAHFCIYTILGFFVSGALLCTRLPKRRLHKYIISLAICVLYAVSDEIHQSFIPGRSCELRDVIIDFSGSLLGTVIMLIAFALFCYLLKRKNKLS